MKSKINDKNRARVPNTLREHLKLLEKSGLNQTEYCRKNGINPNSLSAVRSQLRKPKKKRRASFVEIPINLKNSENESNDPYLEFKLEKDLSINVHISSEIIKEILEINHVSRKS